MKKATIINMTLTSFKESHKQQQLPPSLGSPEFPIKSAPSREKQSMQQLLLFVKLMAQWRGKVQNRDRKCPKEENIPLPLPICEAAQSVIRRYLLYSTEQRTDAVRGKTKMTHDRNNTFRALLRPNKQNETHNNQQQDEVSPFRNMALQQYDRQRLIAHNRQLQLEVQDLRQRLRQKNETIGKIVSREGQMKRKFNEEVGRLLRNRNINNINLNFERQEEEGQGRMALNVAGRTITEPYISEDESVSTYNRTQQTPVLKTLQKSDSEYNKENRPRVNKAKKLHAFRVSKPCPSANSQFLRNINRSLETECISRRQDGSPKMDLTRQKFTLEQEKPTFQLYVNQLQSTSLLKHQQPNPKKSPMTRMREEQFQKFQLNGFYNDQTLKQMDAKLKI